MKSLRKSLLLAGFFLLIFGAKLRLIEIAGSDLPTWDQWDAEGESTFRPWMEGTLGIHHLVVPYNEHRLITTKLYVLGLFALNRQWDAFFETTANAAVHTLCGVVLLLLAWSWLDGAWRTVFGGLLLLLFTLPFSDDNTLVGFQVQFYFLQLFSIGHIVLTLESERCTGRWIVGQLCGGLALASMASGFFSSAAVLAVLGYRLAHHRRWTVQQTLSAVLALLLFSAGLATANPMPGHAGLKAQNVGQFVGGFLQMLSWPGSAWFPWSIVLFAPALVFAGRRLRSRSLSSSDAVLAGLLCWELLQFVATAYARGVLPLTSRYLDFVAVNVMLGFVFLAREFSGRTRQVVAVLWLAGAVASLGYATRQRWTEETEPNISRQRRREAYVQAYVHTGNPAHLLNKPPGDIPYPDGRALINLLRPPIPEILPPSVRNPVPVTAGTPAAPSALPSDLAPPAFATVVSTWTAPPTAGDVTWRSATQPATSLPVLRFQVAGDLGAPDRNLRLVVKSAAGEVPVVPDTSPGLRWKTVNIFRPQGAWWIELEDHDNHGWFAFTAPVEVGRWTWLSEKLLKHHLSIIVLGALSLLAGGCVHLLASRGQRLDGCEA